jgi:putative protease
MAMIEAGADAVYMAGKQFNMRRHRKDFNFSDEALVRTVQHAHGKGRKVYITVNSLVGNAEIEPLAEHLAFLQGLGVDALIVQDLAVVKLCRERGIAIPLHSSTMMNVNSVEAALFLKDNGFTRVVVSRDITIDEIRRISEGADLEVECFVHGDMCSVQSGQCCQSGIIFGKSSNRGQCMKPCRWKYTLEAMSSGHVLAENAYLLATKDLCVLGQVPELINAGVHSLKIEGRMKPASVLGKIVAAYREAIDRYCENPLASHRDHAMAEDMHRNRVRDLSTGFTFKTPDREYFDPRGEREPIFLSYSGKLHSAADGGGDLFGKATESQETMAPRPEISVVAGGIQSAEAALQAGADNLILSWEGDLRIDSAWRLEDIEGLANRCRRQGTRLAMATPKILTERELKELDVATGLLESIDTYCISGIAPLRMLAERGKRIWADYNCNILNTKSAAFLQEHGVERIFPALEASFADLGPLIQSLPAIKFDLLAHGPLTGMLVEHCLIAMNTQGISKKDFCRMPCQSENYAIIDASGSRRRILTDKYCRNHIMLEHELDILPSLLSFLPLGAAALRIDARLYSPEKTAALVSIYQEAIAAPSRLAAQVARLRQACPDERFSYGAYPAGITRDMDSSLYELKKNERLLEEVIR